MRLDKYVSIKYPEFSRSKVQKFIRDGVILVNGKRSKPAYLLRDSDDVYVKKIVVKEPILEEEKFDLEVLYEDKVCLVINKPAGMVVHPGEGDSHMKGTVANAILSKVSGSGLRPGIVHRLDKDTSGVLVVAKTDAALDDLKLQFSERRVKKVYKVLVSGVFKEEQGVIDSPIGRSLRDRKRMGVTGTGKAAISKYKVLKAFKNTSLLEVKIETGRTHQIRVHMSAIGHPVVGDKVYGDRKMNRLFREEYGLERQFLHAWKIEFKSPNTEKTVNVESKLAPDLEKVLTLLSS